MGSSASFPLSGTVTVFTPATPATRAGYAPAVPASRGRALVRPFRRDGISDFASASGQKRIEAAIGQVLGTRSDSSRGQGELPWRTDFGSRLHQLRHRNNDAVTAALARQYVMEAVERWVPGVQIFEVQVEQEDSVVLLLVSYALVARNTGQEIARGQVRVPVAA